MEGPSCSSTEKMERRDKNYQRYVENTREQSHMAILARVQPTKKKGI